MTVISHPLEFELPLVELEKELQAVADQVQAGEESQRDHFARLESKLGKLRDDIYGNLSSYQRVQLSRHFDRPFTLDFVKHMTSNFVELHGDRSFKDDAAIVGGTARLGNHNVMIVGHQRGRTTQERLKRNFGMPQPEGYRKAKRLFYLAEKFKLPVITLIDTQGAYPGLEAEERGQAEAIAKNLLVLAKLKVPVISVVIGEGGSGGALALGVSDRILMLENACYSVITPEGCASILWRSDAKESPQEYAAVAADALKITAKDLKNLGVVEEVVPEPLGGAHRNHKEAGEILQASLLRHIEELLKLDTEALLENRYKKFRGLGPVAGG